MYQTLSLGLRRSRVTAHTITKEMTLPSFILTPTIA